MIDALVRIIIGKDKERAVLDADTSLDDEGICVWYHPCNYGTTKKRMAKWSDLQKCRSCYDPYNTEGICQGFKTVNYSGDIK